MSADLLREAASLMRERAEAATPGTWKACEQYIGVEEVDPPADGSTVGLALGQHNTVHIASWHPAVALAVADLLERRANLIDRDPMRFLVEGIDDDMFAVARAYLNREA